MIDTICQLWIGFSGIGSVYLTSIRKPDWACVFGLIGQPAWFVTTWINEQWGLFLLAIIYTYVWISGIRNYWFENDRQTVQ